MLDALLRWYHSLDWDDCIPLMIAAMLLLILCSGIRCEISIVSKPSEPAKEVKNGE